MHTKFSNFVSKGHNSEKGHNLDMKKNMGQLFFHEESHPNLYMKFHTPFKSFQFHRKVKKINGNFKIPYFCQNLTESSQMLIRSSTHQPQRVYQI